MSNQQLERVIPLPQAAKRMGLSVEVLTRMVHNGIIRGVTLPNGDILVDEEETRQTIKKEDFKHLQSKVITVSQAAQPRPRFNDKGEPVGGYDIPDDTIRYWIKRGYIRVVKPGYEMELDEQDVAYCAAIYHERKRTGSRAPLFDKSGRPYKLKNPSLAEYRRRKRRTSKS